MREAEEKEEEKECEGGTKCVKERMKYVRGVNNNRTKCIMADGHDTSPLQTAAGHSRGKNKTEERKGTKKGHVGK
jgi:hypothetical protein